MRSVLSIDVANGKSEVLLITEHGEVLIEPYEVNHCLNELNKLKDKFEFIVVTSRNDFETEIAIKKLKTLGFGDIKVFNNEHHKIDKLLEEHFDYMIDDDSNICINAADNGICSLYFKNNASNKVDIENVINVNNWGEIYKYLMLNKGE